MILELLLLLLCYCYVAIVLLLLGCFGGGVVPRVTIVVLLGCRLI